MIHSTKNVNKQTCVDISLKSEKEKKLFIGRLSQRMHPVKVCHAAHTTQESNRHLHLRVCRWLFFCKISLCIGKF